MPFENPVEYDMSQTTAQEFKTLGAFENPVEYDMSQTLQKVYFIV